MHMNTCRGGVRLHGQVIMPEVQPEVLNLTFLYIILRQTFQADVKVGNPCSLLLQVYLYLTAITMSILFMFHN